METSNEKNSDNSQKTGVNEADEEINRLLLSIVSGFSEYFYKVAEDIFEKRPQKIEFNSIRSDRKIGMTGIQLVTVNFSCELGHGRAGLAVKVHTNADQVPEIVSRIDFVASRLDKYRFLGVSTPRIVFHKEQILVLEGISGDSFKTSPVPVTEKFRLAGKCLASFTGPEINKVTTERYRNLEKQVINTLPLEQQTKSFLMEKYSKFPLEELTNNAGSISFGDFHSGNLLYEVTLYKSPILIVHLIDPEFIEKTPNIDRFEDIANFFVNRTIQEFQLKQNLFQITREIKSFIAGYNEILAYDLMALEKCYPNGDTFNYHLSLSILLSILNLVAMEDVNLDYVKNQAKERIILVNYILDSPSFITNQKIPTASKK
ncbi:MAG: hypothetical protein ACW981_03460 [Candidatus Hodarchaeales archaeon]